MVTETGGSDRCNAHDIVPSFPQFEISNKCLSAPKAVTTQLDSRQAISQRRNQGLDVTKEPVCVTKESSVEPGAQLVICDRCLANTGRLGSALSLIFTIGSVAASV